MSVTELTALVIALGSMPVLLKIIDAIRAWRSGRAQAEKMQNRNALGRLVAAEDRADEEAAFRRIVQEYASSLRRLLVEWGYPEEKLPPFPVKHTKVES